MPDNGIPSITPASTTIPGMPTYGGSNPDPNSVGGLLNIADQQGGAVAEQANQLANPNTSILSTIGDGFKNAFGDFVKTISAPSEAVAGLITSVKGGGSITDAIKNGTDPYDAIFGSSFNPNESVLQKVGAFVTRTAVDTLFDPLTFVGDAPWDMLAKDSIPLFGDLAAKAGVEEGEKVAVTDVGQKVTQGLRTVQNSYAKDVVTMGHEQAIGTAMGNFLKTGNPIFNPAGADLKDILKNTLDLSPESLAGKDFINKSVADLLTQHPALYPTLMDRGGFKVLGNTVIEGARIRSAVKMIPGMSTVDEVTKPARNMVRALFDPGFKKDVETGLYGRLPEEYLDAKNKTISSISGSKNSIKQSFYDFAKGHGLNIDEMKLLEPAMAHFKMPADPKLGKAYLDAMGLAPGEFQALQKAGLPVSKQEGYVMPHVWLKDDVKLPPMKPFSTPPSGKTGALEHSDLSKFIEQGGEGFEGIRGGKAAEGEPALDKMPKELDALKNVQGGEGLIGRMSAKKSTQEAAIELGSHLNNRMNELTTGKNAMTFENAMQHPEVKTMMDARNALDSLPQNHQMVGRAEDLGLSPEDDTGATFTDTSGKTYKRMAAALDELDAAGFKGFDHNVLTASMSRAFENDRAIKMRAFMGDVAKTFGTASDVAPAGYKAIEGKGMSDAVSKVFQNTLTADGKQIVFHPLIAQDLENFTTSVINDAPTNDMLKAFDKLQGVWKASVTSIFPQFHGRNLLTHVMNNMLDLSYHALDPATNSMAAQFVRHDMEVSKLTQDAYGIGEKALAAHGQLQDLMTKTMFTDNTGKDWSYGEIRQMVKDYGVSFGHDAGSTEDLTLNNEDFAKSLSNQKGFNKDKINPFSQNFQPFAQGRKMGSILANQQRMVNFISNLRQTGNVELAASRTKQFLFDYGALTNFEKTFMRRIIPFYTFTRKNLELQVRSLLTTPGRIAAEVHSISNLGDVMSGNAKLSAAEQAALPDWIKSGAQIVANKQGENVTLLQGLPLPIEQPFKALAPNAILGSVSPLLRVPIEQATGYSFFQGKPLSDITNAAGYVDAPGIIKKAIGFTKVNGKTSSGQPFTEYVALNPSMMNLFNNLPPTSRVMSSLKEIQESGQNMDTNTQKVMEQLMGAKYYSFDLTQQAQLQQNELKKQLQDELTKAGVTATYSQAYIPAKNPPAPAPKPAPPFGQIAQAADLIF